MSEETQNSSNFSDYTVNIIKAVKDPLAYLTLALLIAQGILMYLAQKAAGTDFTILLIAFIALTFVLIGIVGFLLLRGGSKKYELVSDEKITDYTYDVFLSMPMASLGDTDYVEQRQIALAVSTYLREQCNINTVRYVGEFIDSKNKFDPSDFAAIDDLNDIKNSKFFLMIYPQQAVSSILVEAGMALALAKNCIYFVKNRSHLPFLLRQSEQAFDNVRVYEYATLEDIKKVLRNKKCFTFD